MQEHFDPLTNNIQLSVPFTYPNDETNQGTLTKEALNEHLSIMLGKMATYILPAKDPRLTMIALFYAAGIDLSYILNCNNTESAIAKRIGIPKQTMSLAVKQIRKQFNLVHSTTNKTGMSADKYNNNYRKTTNP